jgi:hypothetical protein
MEQEMALELLQLADGCTDSYARTRAAWAALRWLRRMHGTHMLHSVTTMSTHALTELIDSGRCLRVWC